MNEWRRCLWNRPCYTGCVNNYLKLKKNYNNYTHYSMCTIVLIGTFTREKAPVLTPDKELTQDLESSYTPFDILEVSSDMRLNKCAIAFFLSTLSERMKTTYPGRHKGSQLKKNYFHVRDSGQSTSGVPLPSRKLLTLKIVPKK